MKRFRNLGVLALAAGLAALVGCGDDDDDGTTPDANTGGADANVGTGFAQPAGTVPVNFTVDDSLNKVYTAGDLQWKGSMIYDGATRKVTLDATWGGPWATLYDDGAWNVGTPGGHEPAGATAGDHKWGVTVFVTPPATGSATYEYGLNDNKYQTDFGNGWVWVGSNGSFMVAAGATAPVTAAGQTFGAFGTTDMQVTVDTAALGPGTWDTSMVRIKGSAWAWGNQTVPVTSGKATFTLSSVVGAGKPLPHSGLLKSGDKPEFIIVFGTGDGVEYKDGDGNAQKAGVTAGTKAMGASAFTNQTINNAENKNTFITVP